MDDIQTGNDVVVPSCLFQLSEKEITTLNEIDVFAHDGNTSIIIYLQVVNLLRTLNLLNEIQRCIVKQHLAFFCA